MKQILNNIRKKSRSTRDQYAFYGAVAITLMIGLVWVVSLPASFKQTEEKSGDVPENEQRAVFSTMFSQAKEQFGSMKEAFSSLSTSTVIGDEDNEVIEVQSSSSQQTLVEIVESSQAGTLAPVEVPKVGREVLISTTTSSSTNAAEE